MSNPGERLAAALADRYRLERELGAGGMATVYLAEDLKHQRKVAVKVLRPDLAATLGPERFVREVTIAANLQHPHVLPLYDSGQADGFLFYVMPFVEGISLRQKLLRERELPIPEAVRILRDVADAMAYAHQHGVVHRDIKPENIMLSGRHALVTDFGVAKAVSEATGRQTLTTAGVALGTPTYMAPEQAMADPHTDHRADLYALGVVAYELLTGQPPFTGLSPQAVLAAHVTTVAEPVTVHRASIPPALAALVMKCLEKKPADRWQSAEELIPQLEAVLTPSGGMTPTLTQPVAAAPRAGRVPKLALGVGALVIIFAIAAIALRSAGGRAPSSGSSGDDQSVAVLYFANLARDTSDQYLGDGLTEDVTNSLAQAGQFEVKVPSAVRRAQSKNSADLPAIGATLGVRYLLDGSFRRTETGIRVAVRLVEHAREVALWSNTYDRPREALLDLPGQIAQDVAGHLANGVSERNLVSVGERRTRVPDAYEAFLRGNFLLRQRTLKGNQGAIREFERAVRLDSLFVAARGSLAMAWAQAVDYTWLPAGTTAKTAWTQGLSFADEALSIDSLSSEAWAARAYLLFVAATPKLLGAREAAEKAVQLDPRNVEALVRLGWIHGASVPVNITALETRAREVLALDPNLGVGYGQLALVALSKGQWKQSAAYVDTARSAGWLGPPALIFRAMARLEDGDVTGAVSDADSLSLTIDSTISYYIRAAGGNGAPARGWLQGRVSREASLDEVLAYIGLGEQDEALAALERLSRSPFRLATTWVQTPAFRSLTRDARYQASLAEMRRRTEVR